MKIWESLNIMPNNKTIYETAFRHKSSNVKNNQPNYEKLEWFGDALLQMYASEFIVKTFPDYDEGILTKIRIKAVETNTLAEISLKLKLNEFLETGKGEDKTRKKILADLFESFIAALYFDNQKEVLEIILKATIYRKILLVGNNLALIENPKTIFQELIQPEINKEIKYHVIANEGKQHNALFTIALKINDITMGIGSGKSKQAAEVEAAKAALHKLRK